MDASPSCALRSRSCQNLDVARCRCGARAERRGAGSSIQICRPEGCRFSAHPVRRLRSMIREVLELSDTIHLVGELLGQVISAQESPALFEIEERIRALAKVRRAGDRIAAEQLANEVAAADSRQARAIASAFALYFDLVNLAEEDHQVLALHAGERAQHPHPIGESIADAVAQLKERGVSREQMADLLSRLHVELVLTAHP